MGLQESEVFKDLVVTDTSRGLVHVFFAQRATSKAVIESIPLKQKIFSEIEKGCPPHCILASNTSTIDFNIIGEKTRSQDRIVGAHFFSPAYVMPLLEIVRMEKTSAQVVLDLMAVGKAIKKVPVMLGNCVGFAVNRTFFLYTQSAHILVNLGVNVFRIDRLISSFGLPMGPFQLQDLAGYGVVVAVSKKFADVFPDRTFRSPLIDLLIKDGRNGKNNGRRKVLLLNFYPRPRLRKLEKI